MVDPGVYVESVHFRGKPVRVISAAGPSATYITAAIPGTAAVALNGVTSEQALFSGFTIFESSYGIFAGRSGLISSNAIVNCGFGISCGSGSPVIRGNSIVGCSNIAIDLQFAEAPLIEGNRIEDNAGGINIWAVGGPAIRQNVIRRNGTGIGTVNTSAGSIVQNLIIENTLGIAGIIPAGLNEFRIINNTIVSGSSPGISLRGYSEIFNNIVVGNPPILEGASSSGAVAFNNFYSHWGPSSYGPATNVIGIHGNISANPFFACEPAGDFRLLPNSASIDAGTNGAPQLPPTDYSGGPRILLGRTNGTPIVDQGAFEFNRSAPVLSPCLFLYCPTNMVVVADPGAGSTPVNYAPPLATPGASVTSSPPSGAIFPAGSNVVTATATHGTNIMECTFTVTVLVPPLITTQPQPVAVLASTPTNLTVIATGTAPLSYQWKYEGVLIPGATNSVLSLPNPQAADEGFYEVVVSNSVGVATSIAVLVRVLPSGPRIVTQPAQVTAAAGSNVTFNASVGGSEPFWFQWYFEGTALPGATSSQLVLTNVQPVHTGTYQVVVSNNFGVTTSSEITLQVIPSAPFFVMEPGSAGVPAGSNYTLSATARGTEPISYQWLRNGTNVSGANGSSLTLSNMSSGLAGNYQLVASNVIGVSTSQVAAISVFGTRPVFTEQPLSTQALEGSTLTINSRAIGSPVTYEWFWGGTNLAGRTNRQLVISPVLASSGGRYYAVASNPFGRTTSLVAQVVVNRSIVLEKGLSNLLVVAGTDVTFSPEVTYTVPVTYSWQFNGATLSETGPSLVLTNIQRSQSGYYRFSVANQYGSLSSTSRVNVIDPPSAVVAWGDNSSGQASAPSDLEDAVAIAAGDHHSVALRFDGSVVAWGYNGNGQLTAPAGAPRLVSIAAGANHNLAISDGGSVFAWGDNQYGQCNVPATAEGAVAVAGGESHSIALLPTGFVLAWGDNSFGQGVAPGTLFGIRAIAAGRRHNLALRNTGFVSGWGWNSHGQISVPNGFTATAIAAGYLHSLALRPDRTVIGWGDNSYGQRDAPPGLSNVVAIAAGDFHSLALRSDGSIVAWGNNSLGQTNLPSAASRAVAVASGYYHGLALVPARTLRTLRLSNGFVIEWNGNGILQSAATPSGPFSDIPGKFQSYTNTDISGPAQFFRLR
jgi:parallel beta-helix repeat protein